MSMPVCTEKNVVLKPYGIYYYQVNNAAVADTASCSTKQGRIAKNYMVKNFHNSEFESIDELAGLKASGKKSISVVIPALNEEATIGPIVTCIRQHFVEEYGLVDEIVVMDGMSEDQTVQRATDAGASVFNNENAGPEIPLGGKGVSLWKSQFVTSGDIVIFIDSDITDFDRRFICGLVGPLLRHDELSFVKAYYRRPLIMSSGVYGDQGGRITEILVRPLLNALISPLAGLYQPLSGEYAIRRTLMEELPFWSGYGVEIGLLMDVFFSYGLSCIAQVDMDIRCHRNRNVEELGKTSFAILQVIFSKLKRQGIIDLKELNQTFLSVNEGRFEEFIGNEIELPARKTIFQKVCDG